MSGMFIKIEPNGRKTIHEYSQKGPPRLEILQELVGGYIERVRVKYEGKLRDAYLDEEGLIRYTAKDTNMYAFDMIAAASSYPVIQMFLGPIVIWIPDKRVKKSV